MQHWLKKKKLKEAHTKWVEEQNFTHFGTLKFTDGRRINSTIAIKRLRRFFNMLDRKVLKGKAVKKGTRLARFVYLEKGKSRNNLHAHFYFKGSTQAQTLSTILYATELWHKVNNAETIDIRKQIDKRLNAYCTKEIDDLDNDVMLLDCTHKAQN